MDQLLERRYLSLLYGYEPNAEAIVAEIKNRVIKELDWLRPDAALCLLTLFHQMIHNPYQGRVLEDGGVSLPPAPIAQKGDFDDRIRKGLDHLLNLLRKRKGDDKDPRRSSHEVIIVINEGWETLANLFWWS
jgi:hypothetical protein